MVCLTGAIEVTSFATLTAPFTGVAGFTVRQTDGLIFRSSDPLRAGVALTVNGTLAIDENGTITIPNPPTSTSQIATVKMEPGSVLINYGAISLRNTRGIALWFHNAGTATNQETIDARAQISVCTDTLCAMLVEGTTLDNSQGTISNATSASTIYCNNGTICGGTFAPNPPLPAGSGITGGPTYSPSC